MYVQYNPNPEHKRKGDCVERAISKALNQTWHRTFAGLCVKAFEMGDNTDANAVWGAYLRDRGFTRHIVPHELGDVYTVEDFARDHPRGTYILAMSDHVVCVKDGDWYDSWQSANELPIYYWVKEI